MKKFFIVLGLFLFLSGCNTKKEDSPHVFESVDGFEHTEEVIESKEEIEDFTYKQLELSEYFQDIDGTAIFYTPSKYELVYNEEKADTLYSPYSTFKIMSTVIGLYEGIVTSENSKMAYNGTLYWNKDWNKDMTLKESFQTSCVWFYHQMLYQLEPQDIENHLISMNYGNSDITQWNGNGSNPVSELNGFWLNSSLNISARQQIYFMEKIFEGDTIYDENHIALLKNIMETETSNVFAKTGAGNNQSWYVGFWENEVDVTYFAVFIESNVKLPISSKDITLTIIENWDNIVD